MKLSTYYLNLSVIAFTGLILLSCTSEERYYQKTFSPEESKQLAQNLTDGIKFYYQGSAATQLMLQEALLHDPNNADVHREIGVPYLKRGIASAFPHYYGKAADINPVSWLGWRGYLYLYFYRDYENALADFNLTDTITPNFVDYPQSTSVDFMRGICYLQLGKYEKALEYLDKFIDYETDLGNMKYIDTKAFIFKSIAYAQLGELEKAIASLNKGLTINKKLADLYFYLAQFQVQSGNRAEARKNLNLAQSLFDQGDFHQRPYVEAFYQIYQTDLDALRSKME